MLHTRLSGALVQTCCSSFVWSFVALLLDEVMKSKHLETLQNKKCRLFTEHSKSLKNVVVRKNKIVLKGQEGSLTICLYLQPPARTPSILTLDSAKRMECVTPDYRTPECGIRYLLLYAPKSCYNWCVENRL